MNRANRKEFRANCGFETQQKQIYKGSKKEQVVMLLFVDGLEFIFIRASIQAVIQVVTQVFIEKLEK